MRLLVLGGAGMLGHKMFQVLGARHPDTWCTIRSSRESGAASRIPLYQSDRVIDYVDVLDYHALEQRIVALRPDVIVNCIGVIKQRDQASDPIPSISVNALLPHRLAEVAQRWGGKLVHFSTDCVFTGSKGGYSEADASDAQDLYGRTKYLGEVSVANAITLRTSIIGRELAHHQSLLDWFLAQRGGHVRGFTRVWWSGVTTIHLAHLTRTIVEQHPDLSGLYQVSSGRISKYELLQRLRAAYRIDVDIAPDDGPDCDRSLSGSKLRSAIDYEPPSWDAMLAELISDDTPYDSWRVRHDPT